MYAETELSEWLDVNRTRVRAVRKELEMEPEQKRPCVAYSLDQAVDIAEVVLPGTRQELRAWLEEKKSGRIERVVRVLRTKWRNPKLLKVQVVDSEEVLRVRVKDASRYRTGTVMNVIRGNDQVWLIDPDWDPKKRRRAMRLGERA